MNTCRECDRPARAKGLCQPHYHRARRARLAANTKTNRTRERLDELAWLIDGSVWPVEAAKRCGWSSLASAETIARRHGHPVLAAISRERQMEAS